MVGDMGTLSILSQPGVHRFRRILQEKAEQARLREQTDEPGKEKEEGVECEGDDCPEKEEQKLGSGARFKKLVKKLSARPDIRDPAALAATIGRKKYGKEKFQKMAAAGRSEGAQQDADDIRFANLDEMAEFLAGINEAADDDEELGEAKKWLQKAIKRPGRCTGDKFGGGDCPPGSPQYNLAKRLRKGGDLYKKIHG